LREKTKGKIIETIIYDASKVDENGYNQSELEEEKLMELSLETLNMIAINIRNAKDREKEKK
jgi:hypothetical protein